MSDTTRLPLTRDRVLEAAVELADQHGTDGLSMRKLAKHLGYEVMSLYNHVANKDDLLEGMVDHVASEFEDPPEGLAWKPAIRHIAMSAHRVLVRHRWVAEQWPKRFPGPNRWRAMEAILRELQRANLPEDVADLGFHAVTLHIHGFTQQQITYSSLPMDEAEMYQRVEREVRPDTYPLALDHIAYHQRTDARHDEFGFVLDLILDGLERSAGEPMPTNNVGNDADASSP